MPVVLSKKYSITGKYTPNELALYKEIIDQVRVRIGDDDPDLNILNNKMLQYNDNQLVQLANTVLNDINNGFPRTRYSILQLYNNVNGNIIIDGIILFSLIREGLLQLRNQIDFNDSGLSISMFNKTGLYQSWYGMLAQNYVRQKEDIKAQVIPSSANAGFYGIGSEFGYRLHR